MLTRSHVISGHCARAPSFIIESWIPNNYLTYSTTATKTTEVSYNQLSVPPRDFQATQAPPTITLPSPPDYVPLRDLQGDLARAALACMSSPDSTLKDLVQCLPPRFYTSASSCLHGHATPSSTRRSTRACGWTIGGR